MRKLALILAVSALLAASTAAAAGATPPRAGRFSFEDFFVVQPGDTSSCAFPVTVDLQVDLTFHVFLDQQGQATSVTIHENWFGTASANGKTLPEHGATTEIIDFTTGTDTVVGSITDRLPLGNGVHHDVGIISFDAAGNLTFERGQHQGFDGDTAAFCAALAP